MQAEILSPNKTKTIEVALACLERLGHNRTTCLQSTGITERSLTDPERRIPLSQELAFYRNVANLDCDTPIGLEIGSEYRIENYGIWGLAIMSAQTLRESIRLALQFQSLTYAFFHYAFVETSNAAVIELNPVADFGACREILVDRDMMAAVLILNQVVGGKIALDQVSLMHGPSDNALDYSNHYNCEIIYHADRYAIAIQPHQMDVQPPQHNPVTTEFCARECERQVAEVDDSATQADRVRYRLALYQGDFPGAQTLASELGMSYRTMRRRLNDEGTTYRAILDEARFELAKHYLKETQLPLSEIASRLNFSEPGNFSHAFKRWSDFTPRDYRREFS